MNRLLTLLGTVPDPNTGDGRAARWLFSYVSDSRDPEEGLVECLVVLEASKAVILSREATRDEGFVVPYSWLQAWTIDSDAAAQRAANLSSLRGPGTEAPSAVVYELSNLPRSNDGPAELWWSLSVAYPGQDEPNEILVNAETGQAAWDEPVDEAP